MALSEFDLIRRYFAPFKTSASVVTGIGDDCAVLSLSPGYELCTSIDTLVEDVHFPAQTDPQGLGWRCLAAAVSDLAACGAKPLGFCLAITLPAVDEPWLASFANGLASAADHFNIPLVGGDTTRGPLTLSLQVFGEVASGAALLRSAAQAGDQVWITGCLGDARAALDFIDQAAAGNVFYDSYYYPQPPVQFAPSLIGLAHAAIDISDGLLADLGHILTASAVGADIQLDDIPLSAALRGGYPLKQAQTYALTGGDDYQLCFTAPPRLTGTLRALAQEQGIALTSVGSISEWRGLRCLSAAGEPLTFDQPGYRHFS
ncbi:MAG: thiamine-monophosphate kinase [Bermanella sp.]|jgi:thiamine-monophosphate kinase